MQHPHPTSPGSSLNPGSARGRVPGHVRLGRLFRQHWGPLPPGGALMPSPARPVAPFTLPRGARESARPRGPPVSGPASRWPEVPSHPGRLQVQKQQASPHGVPGTQPLPPSCGTDSPGLWLESQAAHRKGSYSSESLNKLLGADGDPQERRWAAVSSRCRPEASVGLMDSKDGLSGHL